MKWAGREFDLIDIIRDPVWFWQIFGGYEGESIRFDDWQVAHLHDYSRLRAREKAPQIGFSWLSALEATWDCMLHMDATSGFVSVDQREASEKVLYAKKAWHELPDFLHDWVPLSKDSTEELWFGDTARPSRLMSIPATSALRGRRMSVYLDEADFYRDGGKDAVRVALGRITRGGRLTIGSTCFGVDTQLDKIMSGDERNFSRARMPHTVAENPDVIAAVEIARQELDEDDFAEEYECVRGSGGSDSFTVDMIRKAQHDLQVIDPDTLETGRPLVGGYDVGSGAGRHPAELSIAEQIGDQWQQIVLMEVRDKSLPEQERFLVELLDRLKQLVLVVDAQGIGMQISQALVARFHERVIPMNFGKPDDMEPQDRGQMATELRRGLEADEFKICAEKELARQLQRTKIVRTIGGRITVDQPGTRKRAHYDKFWATTYNWYGVRQGRRQSVYETHGLIVVGG